MRGGSGREDVEHGSRWIEESEGKKRKVTKGEK